ncbi:C4b-binding protein beta chain [Suricata suricatta]|uniref:Complement component 4 binding protein beta n=1 Tax=Suricata suricatta TaxID=37032 RepID=A0A673TE70_SURSU|nr:C4b-binding protein beta chain [Suricata suricatta]
MFLRVVCCVVVVWLVPASYESCPELPPVENSIFVAMKEEGQILGIYVCIEGYHLVGEKSFTCNASGEWNTTTPTCQLGHCPDPVLVNGEPSSLGPVNVSEKITFTCNENYILKGSNWSQCMDNHTWMPPLPICKSRDCGPPGNPAHGYFEGRDFNLGSNITYHCEEGYHLVGTRDQRCIDGEWSSELPFCEFIQGTPKPTPQTAIEKVLFAFQEDKELCKAIQTFMQRLKENGLTMEDLKYSLEIKKAELQARHSAMML